MAETMEQYMSKTRADYGSGVARPKIKDKDNFELKGQFLKELRTNTFSGSDHEDANEHIEKVLEIMDLFHIPNTTIDQVMLRAFPMSLTEPASRWLRNKLIGSITTWEDMKNKFLSKYCPPARTTKKIEEINNFQQELAKTSIKMGTIFKVLLTKCPQHFLMELREGSRNMGIHGVLFDYSTRSGPSTALKMTVPSTTEEKICKKNDVKARKWDTHVVVWVYGTVEALRARMFYQSTGKEIIIDGSSTVGMTNPKVRMFQLVTKLGHLAREVWWWFLMGDMAEDENQATMALMAFHDSEVTDKSKRGFGYTAVPSPHPLILNRPTPLDLSYSGLEEFKQPEVNGYGPRDSSLKPTTVCDRESNNSKENTDDSLTQQPKTVTETSSVVSPFKVDKDWKEKFFHPANHVRVEEPKKARNNTDAPIIEDWVSDDEEEVESIPKEEKKADVPTATKKESVKTVKSSRRTVRYAEMYRSQRPRGNQRSWNGQKSDQLGVNFVFNNKACFICGNFDHIQYNCPNAYKHMVPRAVLMRTGLKTVKNAKPLSTVRSVNTVRPVSTARFVNTVRPYNTAHPKPTVSCARPKTHFQNQAQRPFYKNTALTKRSNIQNINTAKQAVNTVRPNVNTVRARGFNASNSQLNEKGFVDSGCSRHMSGNIVGNGGYVTFGGGANGGRITGKGTIKTDKLDFEDVYFVKELKFNLFSVSQMCDKKNYVLFTDSECLVLSPNFKLPDESQILLKIPRQNNMYSFDMKNIVPKDGLTCLVAKATSEESMLWHRRLGHVNFKNINKLVKENLVRDLPLVRPRPLVLLLSHYLCYTWICLV
ncbi:ribonuclease H-like domain-containing protein [Tanacetum coccineum]